MTAGVQWISGVLKFMDDHGISLEEYGSTEKGLSEDQAVSVIRTLQMNHVIPLGIESWRWHGSRWRIDSLGGWYVDGLNGDDAVEDAIRYLSAAGEASGAIFTVQF